MRDKGKHGRLSLFNITADSLRRWIVILMQALMAVELVLAVFRGQWLTTFLIVTIMTITLAPLIFAKQIQVKIPPEIHLMTIIFVFAALFLGEIRDYYSRIWWWDTALHGSSGLLLGIFGFLLVYVLNENERVDIYMRPRFVAIFAFFFAVGTGAIWEIFEFAMDQIFDTQMQKPMFGDTSGLTDTMWDLILDTLGAAAIATLGWWYMKRPEHSFIDIWIQKFIDRNPQLFQRNPADD